MNSVKKYLSLVKFSHTIFAMPFALIGFSLATLQLSHQWNLNDAIGWGPHNKIFITGPELLIKFGLVIGCMITARSAAMAFNRYLDSHFDAQNPARQ
jgi:4-hydroxybenzoate polyprenyltransferase